jgi:HAD superfamily hydrolase (TIGR01490 family)
LEAALFDLDGTLFTGHIWQGLAQQHRARRTHRAHIVAYVTAHMGLWLLHRARLVGEEQALAAWARHMPWLMAGFTIEKGQEVFHRLFDEYVHPRLRDDVLTIVRYHQDAGRPVLLVSGTFQDMLEVIVERLGLQGAAGTQLRVRDGRYTGGAIEPVCFGRGKLARVRQVLAQQDCIDLEACHAYGDTIYDLPLLEAVARATAVYPDHRLALFARQRGWPIVGLERENAWSEGEVESGGVQDR